LSAAKTGFTTETQRHRERKIAMGHVVSCGLGVFPGFGHKYWEEHRDSSPRRGADARVCCAETRLGDPGPLAIRCKRVEMSLDPAGKSACAT
jgi:hypothetical protein